MTLKVCAVTSTRADWGLLAPVLALLRDDPAFDLTIIATGQHVGVGGTAGMIARDGFTVTLSIDMALGGDTPQAVTTSLAVALNGYGAAFARVRPDLLLILGDRYGRGRHPGRAYRRRRRHRRRGG
jgi:UDP-N-acetylglucosamine 2-epimerase